MTETQKKANEIIYKFMPYTLSYRDEFSAKQCAILCVDEILKAIGQGGMNLQKRKFWQEVKEDIINYKN
jgi:hypothetical protein